MAKLSSSQRDKYVAESLFGAEIRSILYVYVFFIHTRMRTDYVREQSLVFHTQVRILSLDQQRPSATRHGASAHLIYR